MKQLGTGSHCKIWELFDPKLLFFKDRDGKEVGKRDTKFGNVEAIKTYFKGKGE